MPTCGVPRARAARDLLLHQQACLDRPAGLERRVVALPDDAVSVLGLKIDAIELLEDVLHLVGDESRYLRRHPKVDVRTDHGAAIEREGGAGIDTRGRPGPILGKDADPDRPRRADSGNLAAKRRRTLSHALDHRLEHRIHVEIRRQTRSRLTGDGQVGPRRHRTHDEEHPNAVQSRCPHAALLAAPKPRVGEGGVKGA